MFFLIRPSSGAVARYTKETFYSMNPGSDVMLGLPRRPGWGIDVDSLLTSVDSVISKCKYLFDTGPASLDNMMWHFGPSFACSEPLRKLTF